MRSKRIRTRWPGRSLPDQARDVALIVDRFDKGLYREHIVGTSGEQQFGAFCDGAAVVEGDLASSLETSQFPVEVGAEPLSADHCWDRVVLAEPVKCSSTGHISWWTHWVPAFGATPLRTLRPTGRRVARSAPGVDDSGCRAAARYRKPRLVNVDEG